MQEKSGSDRRIRVSLGPLAPLLHSMLVELLANVPDVMLVEHAPIDVLLLEAGADAPTPRPLATDLAGGAQVLARLVGLSGILLMEPASQEAILVRLVRERLDLAAEGRTALLAAIRRAALRAEPERAGA